MNATQIKALETLAVEADTCGVYFPAIKAVAAGDVSAVSQIKRLANSAPSGTGALYFAGKVLEILDGV